MDVKKSFLAWRKSRAVYNELSGLSRRELADMGITESDIPRIARQAAKM